MVRDELVVAIARKPFRPFVIAVTDGKRYAIRRPELVMVTLNSVVIGMVVDESLPDGYPLIDFFCGRRFAARRATGRSA